MKFESPEMYCKKCGTLIPCCEFKLNADGSLFLDSTKRPVRSKVAMLGCEPCALAAQAPEKRKRKMKEDERMLLQASFEVPYLVIS